MKICAKCNYTNMDAAKFCSNCGTELVEVQFQPQPQYEAPQPTVPKASKGSLLAKSITGMALSIAGISMAGLGLLYASIFLFQEGTMAFIFSLVMSAFSLPMSIVGLKLSANSIEEGSTSNMCRVGKKLGIVGIILSGAMLFLGLIGLGIGDDTMFY